MNKKIIISLILLTTLVSIMGGCLQKEETFSNYGIIQEAIDAAEDGATIIIKKGTYNELIVINKTIILKGEDKNTTIINFNPEQTISQVSIITINADNCFIENLQITQSNKSIKTDGISINSNHNTIKNTSISNLNDGIKILAKSKSNTIIHNELKNNQIGIEMLSSDNNNISHNILSHNQQYNIYLSSTSDTNKVFFNIMNNSNCGIRIKGSKENHVYKNCIKDNGRGIYCCCGANSNYLYNNALFNNSIRNGEENEGLINIWYDAFNGVGNYWDNYTGTDEDHNGIGDIPYVIPKGENQDIYPLMTPPLDVPCSQ